jgi:hypothetical protein
MLQMHISLPQKQQQRCAMIAAAENLDRIRKASEKQNSQRNA